MRKLFLTCIICMGMIVSFLLVTLAVGQQIFSIPFFTVYESKEQQCFDRSCEEIDDSHIVSWDSVMQERNITSAFGAIVFFIEYFSGMEQYDTTECLSFGEIRKSNQTDARSSAFVTSAILQKYGWDVQCFFNDSECYLGVNLTEDWKVRKANWVEKQGKKYYLKEFNLTTALGELTDEDPATTYRSLSVEDKDLKPVPIIRELPDFAGPEYEKEVVWSYNGVRFALTLNISQAQVEWTRNLPPSLHGMAQVGIEEVRNIGLLDTLMALMREFDEFNQVNFLFKFCQSDSVFIYDGTQPIKSVSQQLLEGRNDCDGRSVVLYSLLRAILEYKETEIVFLSWPNHIALGLRPKTTQAMQKLEASGGYYTGDRYYVLDAAYTGDTQWGSKMERLTDACEVVR